jgi:hypothetical protein
MRETERRAAPGGKPVQMRRRALAALLLAVACGDASDDRPECPCGSPLDADLMAKAFEEELARFTSLACDGVPAFRAECSDGKTVLYFNGGFGHSALYYADRQLVGTSSSSDVYFDGCPNYFRGSLADVTCAIVNAEPLCPTSPYPSGSQLPESLEIPFGDGQLSPWCGPS